MNSGCICCSLVGDFGKSLEEVLTKYKPDRVIIEPSGVGKLSDVMNAVRNVASQVEVTLNSAVTIVDASKCKMYMKNFGEFFDNQIENAGTIVLSRTDVLDEKKVQEAVELLRKHNQKAAIVTTPCSRLSGAQLLAIIEKPDTMAEDLMREVQEHRHEQEEECGCGCHDHEDHEHHHEHLHEHGEECGCGCHDHEGHEHHHEHGEECGCGCHDHEGHEHHHHHADEVFSSWGFEHGGVISRKKLQEILEALAKSETYGQVLRAKGMLPGEDGQWYYFDLVPQEYEIRIGAPDYTGKVCVIGAGLKEEQLENAFGRG